jgi:hypothetical protein
VTRTVMSEALIARTAVGIEGLATYQDLLEAAAYSRVRVRTFPGIRDLPGVCRRSIWLSDDLSPGRRRYVLAHELGHYRLLHHTGVSLYTSPLTGNPFRTKREESEADLFAGVLLFGFPGPQLEDRIAEARDCAYIPDDCFLRFVEAVRPQMAKLRAFFLPQVSGRRDGPDPSDPFG